MVIRLPHTPTLSNVMCQMLTLAYFSPCHFLHLGQFIHTIDHWEADIAHRPLERERGVYHDACREAEPSSVADQATI